MTFIDRQRAAKRDLVRLQERPDQVFIVHYSCESFYDTEDGRTPRITSIACRNYGTGQTRSFSIHQVAELPNFQGVDPWERYNDIEEVMLSEYFEFVRENVAHSMWVHWNMRDINYGFAALEHRFKILEGQPAVIPDEKKFDMARILVARYGKRYAGHPRLESVVKNNRITDRDFLSGKDEAYAFKDRKFTALHQSTLRKVDIISNILDLASSGSLKTNASIWDKHGGSARQIWEKYIWTPGGKVVSTVIVVLALVEWVHPNVKTEVAMWVSEVFSGSQENQ